MTDPSGPTPRQQLMCVKKTGHVINLKPYEEIVLVSETAERIIVSIKAVELRETRTGFVPVRTGVKMYVFEPKSDSLTWSKQCYTAWDEQPDIDFFRTMGRSVSPAQHRENVTWALDCHRPGTDSFPLDNSARTFEHMEYAPTKMVSWWMK